VSPTGDPRRLADDLDRVVAGLGAVPHRAVRPAEAAPARGTASLFAGWPQLVGADIAAHAWPLRIEQRRLVVGSDDASWAAELRWLAADLLERIAQGGGPRFDELVVRVRPRRPQSSAP
jgi:predicted nucleic acid-binding Zn ribbon protein